MTSLGLAFVFRIDRYSVYTGFGLDMFHSIHKICTFKHDSDLKIFIINERYLYTVKPVYKGHSKEPENAPFVAL